MREAGHTTQVHQRGTRYGIDTWTVFAGRPIDDIARIAAAVHSG